MEKVIVDTKRSKVVYDEEKKIYIKYFFPKCTKKIKYFLGIRKYPGKNCEYINKVFEINKIRTAKILEVEKYKIVTQEVKGNRLSTEILTEKRENLIQKYIELVSKIIKLNIYFGDFNFDNFIVNNQELYVIDLEDYRKDLFSGFRRKSVIKRLYRYLVKNKSIENGEAVFNEIMRQI